MGWPASSSSTWPSWAARAACSGSSWRSGRRRRGRGGAGRPRPPAAASRWEAAGVLAELRRLTPEELSDLAAVAKTIDLTGEPESLDAPRSARPPPAGQSAWAATLGGRAGGGALRLAQGHPGRRAGGPGGGRRSGRRPRPPAPGRPQAPRRRRPARWRCVTPPTSNRPSTCDFVCTQPSGNDILLSVPLEEGVSAYVQGRRQRHLPTAWGRGHRGPPGS